MRRILVLYGTTEGHTGKVANFIGETLRGQGAAVDVVNAANCSSEPNPANYDSTIVAASVHAGGYQRTVRKWVARHASGLNVKPTAFVSVCLGVLERNPQTDRDLGLILERFCTGTGWRPTEQKVVAGALPYTKYNWLKRWIMLRIVRKAHGDTDTSRDFEYTDWNNLRSFVTEFFLRNVIPLSRAG